LLSTWLQLSSWLSGASISRGEAGTFANSGQVRLAEQSYPDIRFVEGDAEALPFTKGEFDVVLNAFGLHHVLNPDIVVAEAYRVLKPAGRFACAAWAEAAKCIGFSMFYDAIRAHGSLDVGLPPGPNFFAYGDPDFSKEMLRRAGFTSVSTREVPLVWRVSSAVSIIEAISRGTVRAAAVLNRQSPESLAKIKQSVHERISGFRQDGVYAIPTPALVVAGRR
jgi:SAM-dependent methyltransferase